MNTFMHLDMAGVIQRIIEEEFPVRLHAFSFKYGSIKPDISPDLVKIPHYITDSINFLKLQIEELTYLRMKNLHKYKRQFSEKLGIIIHYLADFFCYVHSDCYKGTIIEHYIYEYNLSNYFRLYLKKLQKGERFLDIQVFRDFKAISNYIDDEHKEYMKMNHSYAVDLKFSLRVCMSVCISVVMICVGKEAMLAA